MSVLTLTEGDNHSFLLQSPLHSKARFSTIFRADSIPVSGTGGDPFLDIRKMGSLKKITRKSDRESVSRRLIRFRFLIRFVVFVICGAEVPHFGD